MKKLITILLFLTFGILGNAESISNIIEKELRAKGGPALLESQCRFRLFGQ